MLLLMDDQYDLNRFIVAQDADGTYERAVAELRRGHKASHWMWFVFPQLSGLGRSATSRHFAISSLAEAKAYLAHPLLGARLVECAQALTEVSGRDATAILGSIDAVKLQSSMTLFGRADPDNPIFGDVLDHFFAGRPDPATDERL
jgi:uncharacterized protein (DUF1810 family)